MTNIADFDFSNHKNLEILAKYESVKQRSVDEPPPHVALMKKMAIADYEPASDVISSSFESVGFFVTTLELSASGCPFTCIV